MSGIKWNSNRALKMIFINSYQSVRDLRIGNQRYFLEITDEFRVVRMTGRKPARSARAECFPRMETYQSVSQQKVGCFLLDNPRNVML